MHDAFGGENVQASICVTLGEELDLTGQIEVVALEQGSLALPIEVERVTVEGDLPPGLDIRPVAIEEPNSDGELAPSSSFSKSDILSGPLGAWRVNELPGPVDTDDTGVLISVLVSSDGSLDRQAVHTVRLGDIHYRANGQPYSFSTNRVLGVVAHDQFDVPEAVECIPDE